MRTHKSLTFTLVLFSTIMVAFILVIGQKLIVPFIVALLIWQLINTVANGIKRIPRVGKKFPNSLCMLVAIVFLGFLAGSVVSIIGDNVTAVIDEAPRYQDKLLQIMHVIESSTHVKVFSLGNDWVQQLDLKNIVLRISSVFTTLTGNAVLIFLYVIFLFIEQKVLRNKAKAFFATEHSHSLSSNMVHYVVKDTQIYLGIKTLTSLLTAFLSWLIMQWIGLDFAEFWALLIFFLNFIPNIGSIIATVFPALLAIIQFTEWEPFLEITLGFSLVQFLVGNVLEPRLMGYSLNLSPLVILIALVVWGALWGVIGMFLSVPITVTMMIIFSHFEKTRGIAVLLSRDGTLKKGI